LAPTDKEGENQRTPSSESWCAMLYLHYELQIVVDSIEKSRNCKKNIVASSLASEEGWLALQTRLLTLYEIFYRNEGRPMCCRK
jgi:hypothetical protein